MSLQENARGQYSKSSSLITSTELTMPAFGRENGSITHDRTCFHTEQASWGAERANYAPIIFQYQQQDHLNPSYVVGNMEWEGKVVIDYWLRPVRAFQELPLALSSKYEAMLMEAAKRTNSHIVHHDFRARM